MSRYINPQPRYVDDNGKALAGGKLFFYSAGTVTERDTYSDAAFTVPNTNPVILDANGRPQVSIFLNGSYKVVLKDALDNTIWEKDPVGGTIGVAAFDNWINDATYSVGDIVTASDGDYYQSLTNGNIGLDPTIETNDWVRVQLVAEWRSAVTYKTGDIIKGSDDVIYTSLSDSNLANNPISDAVNWSSVRDYAGVANGFASLDGDGLVPASQIPPIAITDVYVVANQAARLALDAQVGDIAVQNDNNTAYILQSLPASTNANWIEFGIQGFGSAAFRDIGTGTDQVPDKEILDTRLGTTGSLGNAATRNVGTAEGNVAEYSAVVGRTNDQTITGVKIFSTSGSVNVRFGDITGKDGLDSITRYMSSSDLGTIRYADIRLDPDEVTFNIMAPSGLAPNIDAIKIFASGGVTFAAGVTATGYNRTSDDTLKRIKQPLDCTREELDSIGVYLFEWLDVEEVNEQQRGTEDSGVMAQELLAIEAFKHCVHQQDNGKYTVDYGKAAFIYAILDRKLTKRGE